jgi:hypothetical protein
LVKYAKETVLKAALYNADTEDPNRSILDYWLLLPKELQNTCSIQMTDICRRTGWNGMGMQQLIPFLKWILCNRPDIVETLRKHRAGYSSPGNAATLINDMYRDIT